MVRTFEARAILRDVLLRSPGVYALTDDAIYRGHTKDAEKSSSSRPSVVIHAIGGRPVRGAPMSRLQFHVYAYGLSADDSEMLYEQVHNVLTTQRLESTCGQGCLTLTEEPDEPVEGYNERTCSYYTRGTFAFWSIG